MEEKYATQGSKVRDGDSEAEALLMRYGADKGGQLRHLG